MGHQLVTVMVALAANRRDTTLATQKATSWRKRKSPSGDTGMAVRHPEKTQRSTAVRADQSAAAQGLPGTESLAKLARQKGEHGGG